MANTPILPFFGHNNTVKAWCLTGNFAVTGSTTQTIFDSVNFVDGYNLRLDVATNTGAASVNAGALKFSFINSMPNTKYKVFVQCYGNNSPVYPQFAHVLNSAAYPKTRDSFYVRVGFFQSPTTRFSGVGRSDNQVENVVLWTNALSSIGVVVI
jgi:hypothetical protein